MKVKRRLKRNPNGHYCECGCGQEVTKIGNSYICGHHLLGKKQSKEHKKKLSLIRKGRKHTPEAKRKMSLAATNRKHTDKTKKKLSLINIGKKLSKETKKKLSIAHTGKIKSEKHRRNLSLANIGKKLSEEHKFKIGLAGFKCRTDNYCNAWGDLEYKSECRKVFCESCGRKKEDGWKMNLHHINLDKSDCRPINFITLCVSCHMLLHNKLNKINNKTKTKKDDFIILIRKDIIKYIHKETRQEITISRI